MQQMTSELQLRLADGEIGMEEDRLEGPLDHLAYALGSCLLHFTDRFLDRREWERNAEIRLLWTLDKTSCRIEGFDVQLFVPGELDSGETRTLHRMLDTCPVHQALQPGTAIQVSLQSLESRTSPHRPTLEG